jgi:DNA-binding transcriptional ArsR family regulator
MYQLSKSDKVESKNKRRCPKAAYARAKERWVPSIKPKILRMLRKEDGKTVGEMACAVNYSETAVRVVLRYLREEGIIISRRNLVGDARTVRYYLVENSPLLEDLIQMGVVTQTGRV